MIKYCLLTVVLLLGACLTAMGQVGELPRSTPEEQGVSGELIKSFIHNLTSQPNVDVHHLMILRHGKVIHEDHAAPYRATDVHTLYSASKTVTGLAVGLAVDDGLLTVDDKVSKYLRDKMPATLSPALDSLTVRNLLMMAAGRVEDKDNKPENESDWLTAWFAGEFQGVGKEFFYDSMCTHALAAIVTRVTGKSLLDYVNERIFTPLHITVADWELAPDSIEAGCWGLRLQAESEAKLGLLMLHQGNWNGQQLVSAQWIHDMTQRLISTEKPLPKLPWKERFLNFLRQIWHSVRSWFTGYNTDDYFMGYGYQTKAIQHPRAECFFAAGYGGQLIYVVPELDFVIVINGRAANYGHELNTIYYNFIEPFLDNAGALMKAAPIHLSIEMPQGNATHPLEDTLLRVTYGLEDNLLGLQYLRVSRSGNDRVFTMIDKRGPLRAIAACGEWRITTSDERPIYSLECLEPLLGTPRPFTTAAAYAWQGDTLVMRADWLDGGDNRRLKVHPEGTHVTVIANESYDALLTDTIRGEIAEVEWKTGADI